MPIFTIFVLSKSSMADQVLPKLMSVHDNIEVVDIPDLSNSGHLVKCLDQMRRDRNISL